MLKYLFITFLFFNGYSFSQENIFDPILNAQTIKINKKGFKKIFNRTETEYISIIFLAIDCPISQKYMNRLKELRLLYNNKISFHFYLTGQTNRSEKIEFIENYALDFDIYIDHKNKKAKHLGAKVTPEVFLLDQEYTIHYNGAIDNWFYSLGKNRNLITSHYLEDAMNSLLNGTKIQIPYVQAIGCYIE